MECRNWFTVGAPGKRLSRGFSLIETLVAAAVVCIAIVSVVAIIRKGQEQMWVEKHRRVARAIVDTTLEGAQYYPGNFLSIKDSSYFDWVGIDSTITGKRLFTITSDTLAGVPYKQVHVKVQWTEPAVGLNDSVEMERLVPNIPTSVNIAPWASAITASSHFEGTLNATYYDCSPWMAVDGIIGLRISGDWAAGWIGPNYDMSPWIRLQWALLHSVYKIVLYDRVCGFNTTDADIYFYRGGALVATISVRNIPPQGSKTVFFSPKLVDAIRIDAKGGAIFKGFSEIEIYE